MIINFNKYPQNAVALVSHRYSLYQTVLLSYYQVSRCSLLIKTFPLCLIQATYCKPLDSSQKYINATQTTGETNEKYTSSTSSTYNQESTCQIRQVHNVSYDYSQLSVFSNGASCYCK